MRPTLEDEWDLEPWNDDPDGVDAHYIRESIEPEIDDEGREIWLYLCSPAVSTMTRPVLPGIVLTSARRHGNAERGMSGRLPIAIAGG
jgi:hypothetical protein